MGRPTTPEAASSEPADIPHPLDDPSETGDEPETGPLRRCAQTRERLPKEKMIRFVIGPDRQVVPDLAARLPGRGIWLSAVGDVIETACIRGAFAKAARGPVTVPRTMLADLRLGLARRIAETIGLARRAGQAVSGFAKAHEWLVAGRVGVVVQAHDGSPDERARFFGGRTPGVAVIAPVDRASLGAVFGRDDAVHVAIATGRLAERLCVDAERLAGLDSLAGLDRSDGMPAGSRRQPKPLREGRPDSGQGLSGAPATGASRMSEGAGG